MVIQHKHCIRAKSNFLALERAVKVLGHPITGPLAVLIWCLLSSPYYYESLDSSRKYRKLGYLPFAGYPLTRLADRKSRS